MIRKSSLALIVPCYNEEESIPAFAAELSGFINQFAGRFPDFSLSVFVVDNNSSDQSLTLLTALQKQITGFRLESCPKQGYGAALKYGFSRAEAEYLCFLDLDNTYPLASLMDLLNTLIQQELDMIYGARIHSGSDIGVVRRLGNQFYVGLLRFLFNSNLSDVCSGMRVFRGSLKKSIIELKSDDLSFSIDFTSFAVVNRWKISELPIAYRDRTGESKLSVVRDGILFLLVILSNFFRKKTK